MQKNSNNNQSQSAILIAAMGLSGVVCSVQAQEMPSETIISFKALSYQESQPSLKRVGVESQALSILAPIASEWSLDATLVSDQVSGASPRYHTAISSASGMSDNRTGADIKITRHFNRSSLGAGFSYSNENDYLSHAKSIQYSVATLDNNTSLTIGIGSSSDHMRPTKKTFSDSRKTRDLLLSLTQVISKNDVMQFSTTYVTGEGYYSDPYKSLDVRPRERQQHAYMLKWNHFFEKIEGSLRLQYRYYRDSFQIRSHTLSAEYGQVIKKGWVLTPSVRLYSQTAAHFYFDPEYTFLFIPKGYQVGSTQFVSEDQRLSAFGGRTVGLKLAKTFHDGWTIDLKYERYLQRSKWTFFDNKRLELAPLNVNQWQLGISRSY